MKTMKNKILATVLTCVLLLTPTIVYAASYSTTFNFLVSVTGKARSFSSGDN